MWCLWRASSAVGVDEFLNLCDANVRVMEDLVRGGSLLNQKQCEDLSSKLSRTTLNARHLVGAPSDPSFRPALEDLYRYLDKAKLLVHKCAEERWWEAAVFQMQNENAFREVLLEVGLCYHTIYELARSRRESWSRDDLWQPSDFEPAADSDVREDEREVRRRLEEMVNTRGDLLQAAGSQNLLWDMLMDLVQRQNRALKECLARYLLLKLTFTSEDQSLQSDSASCRAILWKKESEPEKTWQMCKFLGSGSYSSGVCSARWLGVPCAKKEFHDERYETILFKEADILMRLRHPRVVSFLCCGNGEEKGDRFIAMELMEMNLLDLIKAQKGAHFSLPVVLDVMIQMARGMCYLHDQGVAHRDLKPHNVVVNRVRSMHLEDYFCVKLVDFGVSKTNVENGKSHTMTYRGIGTTVYRAPEARPDASPEENSVGKVNWFKADAYSFGMTCVHLLSLKKPFEDIVLSSLYNELLFNGLKPKLPSHCPKELVELLNECCNCEPKVRPSFLDISKKLATFRKFYWRGFASSDMDFDFIKKKLDKHSLGQRPRIQSPLVQSAIEEDIVGEETEGETFNSNNYCILKQGNGEDYLKETYQLDGHQNHPHAIYTKSLKKIMLQEYGNLLTFLQCLPSKKMFSTLCNQSSRRYCFTLEKQCAFERQGMRCAVGLRNFIEPTISLAMHKNLILTNSLQYHRKARLAFNIPAPRSCLHLI